MVSLRLVDVTVTRGGRDVLSSVSLSLEPGWTAIVGPNGAGKSTLLEVLAGALAPDEGRREGDALRGVLVPQSVETPTTLVPTAKGASRAFEAKGADRARRPPRVGSGPSFVGAANLHADDPRQPAADLGAGAADDLVAELALRWDKAALRWRGRLGLDGDPCVGSYGERRRWQVAAALAAEPDMLLLDEPTNHLDGPSLALLLDALSDFRGLGVIVSHDRGFLRALAERVIFVEGGRAELHPCGFEDARATRDEEKRARSEDRERRAAAARKLERVVAAKRRAREEAQTQRSARARMRSRNDSDARGIGAQYRADRAEGSLGREVGALAERAQRARRELEAIEPDVSHLGDIELPSRSDAPRWLMRAALPDLVVGGRVVVPARRVDLPRGARVRLAGANGAGKSTLIGALVETWEHAPERLFVLPQDLDPEEPSRRLRALDPDTRGRALALVARLGSDPRALLASPRLSPGEARKLAITIAVLEPTWLLVLDEPTNHLDLPARERLEEALRAYDGALVLTTHDDDFAAAVTDERWELDGIAR
ncbi:MAG: ABC-F family ATP-binding cassette domain-containing protein [Myxococcales bacterium]|nr:ABC-F family ATP-binding cassette domain-containing protein [Myxococcales bacterium]